MSAGTGQTKPGSVRIQRCPLSESASLLRPMPVEQPVTRVIFVFIRPPTGGSVSPSLGLRDVVNSQ